MPRNLNASLATELAKGSVRPFYLCELTLASGVERVWTGVGPLVFGGNTYSGLGELAGVGAVHESGGVQADGTTISLNIAPSQLAIPTVPVTPLTPPRATVAGESIAWSYARTFEPYVLNGPGGPLIGSTVSTLYSGTCSMSAGDPLGQNGYGVEWFNFGMPLEVPRGARITGVYAALDCSANSSNGSAGYIDPLGTFHPLFTGPGAATVYSGNLVSLANVFGLYAQELNTVEGPADISITAAIAMAVYYMGSPLTTTSLLYEAMSDVRVGAPVKLWFGMLSAAGAIVGAPFLVYSGLVDEPSIDEDPAGTKIVLALENRLRNHARAGGRRYTAADQKLDFPNDSGFNFVPILQEDSLKWGS